MQLISMAAHPFALGSCGAPSVHSSVLCSLFSARRSSSPRSLLSALFPLFSTLCSLFPSSCLFANTVGLITPWTLWTKFELDFGTLVLYHSPMEIHALYALCRDSRLTTRPCCRSFVPAYRTGSPEVVPLRFNPPILAPCGILFEPHLNYFAHGDIQSPLRTSAPRGAEACFRDAREWPITQDRTLHTEYCILIYAPAIHKRQPGTCN